MSPARLKQTWARQYLQGTPVAVHITQQQPQPAAIVMLAAPAPKPTAEPADELEAQPAAEAPAEFSEAEVNAELQAALAELEAGVTAEDLAGLDAFIEVPPAHLAAAPAAASAVTQTNPADSDDASSLLVIEVVESPGPEADFTDAQVLQELLDTCCSRYMPLGQPIIEVPAYI
jgi:hypothetical protein